MKPIGVPAALAALALAGACAAQQPVPFSPAEISTIVSLSTRAPLPADPGNRVADDANAARLGRALFFEKRLSRSGEMACATCHDPEKHWADGRPLPTGAPEDRPRHTPSLWNVAHNRWFFWDGRADSLWAQSLQPFENPNEMNQSRAAVIATIAGDPPLRGGYESIFGALPMADAPAAEIDRAFANVGKALAAFERTIVSGDTPFDRFARALHTGSRTAGYPIAAQRGLKLFVGRAACINCHHGGELTDREFHNIGLTDAAGIFNDPGRFEGIRLLRQDPFNAAGSFTDDRGESSAFRLRHLADREEAWGEFKTPTLRNVAKTAPYMHDGRFATLADVVNYYSTLNGAKITGADQQHLKPLHLDAGERDDLLAFLETLTADDAPAGTSAYTGAPGRAAGE